MDSYRPKRFFQPSIDWLRSIEDTKSGVLKISGPFQYDMPISVEKSAKAFNFTIDCSSDPALVGKVGMGPLNTPISVEINGNTYVGNEVYITGHSLMSISGIIDDLQSRSIDIDQNHFCRAIIPLEKELLFHYQLEERGFETDFGHARRTGSVCIIDKNSIYISVFRDDKNKFYLSFESQKPLSFSSFSEKVHAVRNALAYLTGYYAGDWCYIFTYADSNLKEPEGLLLTTNRRSIYSIYHPLHTNSYAYLSSDRKLAETYYNHQHLKPVSIDQFSSLAKKIYTDTSFASAILLILESSVSSLLFMPAGYAIALETLATQIKPKNKKRNNPINKSDWKELRKAILEVVKDFDNDHNGNDLETIKARINDLNRPTNLSQLRAPFDFLGIALTKDDEKVIKARNDFLHGRVPNISKSVNKRNIDSDRIDLYYAALRLYTLLNMLILKSVGFDGYILNHPKIQEKGTGFMLQEKPYRKV